MKYVDSVSAYPYVPPRVTFIGSDPKIPALRKALKRVASVAGPLALLLCKEQLKVGVSHHRRHCIPCRFVRLMQAKNRRTRVLMFKVRDANAR